MKKVLITVFIFTFSIIGSLHAQDINQPADKITENKSTLTITAEERIKNRVEEIYEMDLQSLSRDERKELRKELKELKKESSGLDNRISISVGALIIIILLIILIF